MNANRLIEEWRQQGRILEVEGANTVLWTGKTRGAEALPQERKKHLKPPRRRPLPCRKTPPRRSNDGRNQKPNLPFQRRTPI
jgi:hypothetical protein